MMIHTTTRKDCNFMHVYARQLPIIIIASSLLLLAGCSGKPTEQTAKDALIQRLEKSNNGMPANKQVRLVTFKKTNGVELEHGGVKGYRIEYDAVIKRGSQDETVAGRITFAKTDNGWRAEPVDYNVFR